jgi:hypothetical protein
MAERAWSRRITGWLAGLLILTAAAGWTATPASAGSAPAGSAPAGPQTADARACGPLPSFPAGTADQIMAGRLTIAPFGAVTIDPHRDGRIDWAQDPYRDPTWVVDFQDGQWIEALVEAYLAGGPSAEAYRDRAKALLLGWLSQVPAVNQQPDTLICSAGAFPGQAWIHDKIPVLLDYEAAHWQGAYNHGLKQDLQLLTAGCAYPAQDFGGQAAKWRDVARRQMIESFEPNQYGPALDAQGVTNEQSTGYANFDMGLWDTAEQDLAACGLSLPGWITSRIAQLPTFLAMATQPDGKLAQIGDTYVIGPRDRPGTPLQYAASMGRSGTPPAQRVAVYQAGYVFGRSGWSPFGDQSFYSLRFGPGTEIHGHDDHMGLTYYARGRNLIVDAGHYGYANTPYRAYLLSPEAASVLVMPGVPFDSAAPTRLIRQDVGADGQFFEFGDTAFGGRPRYRSVYVDQDPADPDLVLVFDRASGASRYQQLWHLDPGLTVTTVTRSYAVAAAPGTQLEIRQIPLPGQQIPAASTQVVRGQVNPDQGWVSHTQLQRIPAPVVTMTRTGSSAAILTLIAPTAPGTAIGAAVVAGPRGWYRLRVQIGGRQLSFLIGAGGDIQAG